MPPQDIARSIPRTHTADSVTSGFPATARTAHTRPRLSGTWVPQPPPPCSSPSYNRQPTEAERESGAALQPLLASSQSATAELDAAAEELLLKSTVRAAWTKVGYSRPTAASPTALSYRTLPWQEEQEQRDGVLDEMAVLQRQQSETVRQLLQLRVEQLQLRIQQLDALSCLLDSQHLVRERG